MKQPDGEQERATLLHLRREAIAPVEEPAADTAPANSGSRSADPTDHPLVRAFVAAAAAAGPLYRNRMLRLALFGAPIVAGCWYVAVQVNSAVNGAPAPVPKRPSVAGGERKPPDDARERPIPTASAPPVQVPPAVPQGPRVSGVARFMSDRQAQEALQLLNQVAVELEKVQGSGKPLNDDAVWATLESRCVRAQAQARRALKFDPRNRRGIEQAARAALFLSRVQEARLALDAPAAPGTQGHAAVARLPEAERQAEQARVLVDDVSARIMRWERRADRRPLPAPETAVMERRCRQALEHSARSINLDPGCRLAWVQRIRAHRLLGEEAEAKAALKTARSQFPGDPSLGNLGRLLQ